MVLTQQNPGATRDKALILVVHAYAGHSRPVETILEGAGFEVVSASEADEIRLLLEYGRPDLVVVAAGDPSLLAAAPIDTGQRPVLVVVDGREPVSIDGEHACCSLGTLVREVRTRIAEQTTGMEATTTQIA